MKLLTLNIENLRERALSNDRTEGGYIPSSVRRARNILKILKRDDFKCVKCGSKKDLTIDHINGRKFAKHDNHQKYRIDKCVTLCMKCHIKKNIKTLKKLKGGDFEMEEEMEKVESQEETETPVEEETTETSEDSEDTTEED